MEPHPVPAGDRPDLRERADQVGQTFTKHISVAVGLTLGILGLIGCCGGITETSPAGSGLGVLMFITLLGGGVAVAGLIYSYTQARSAPNKARAQAHAVYQGQLAQWWQRHNAFEEAERANVEELTEWGAATTAKGTRRIDIVGGTLWGWEGFLTIFGASMLATRHSMTLVDLSGEAVSRELVELAASENIATDVQTFPRGLATSDLLVGLSPRQLVDVIVESIYGDSDSGERANRMMDDRILTEVCATLGSDLSMGRLAAALRLLMGQPGDTSVLTDDERRTIADDLFSDEYRREAHAHLRRIESFVRPLEELGVEAVLRPPTRLNCIATISDGHNARNDLLNDLLVQWLMRRIHSFPESVRTLVVAGADELARRHIERLADLCERRDVRLVYMFRHLRDTSGQVLGNGAVGFMRLGNHEEATRAADLIGRHHKFVISQLTKTLGGSETHTTGTSEGFSDSDGGSKSWGGGHSGGGSSWNQTRNWGSSESYASGTNWSDATSQQRVYEHAVEPRTIQDLPDYAMLLVESRNGERVVTAVECNPDIVTLPRLTMEPLADLPLPQYPSVAGQLPEQQIPTSGFRHTAGPAPVGRPHAPGPGTEQPGIAPLAPGHQTDQSWHGPDDPWRR